MTSHELTAAVKVAGLNQTKKALSGGAAKTVFIACDADTVFTDKVKRLCEAANVAVDTSYSMDELGRICKIEVGCAVCCTL